MLWTNFAKLAHEARPAGTSYHLLCTSKSQQTERTGASIERSTNPGRTCYRCSRSACLKTCIHMCICIILCCVILPKRLSTPKRTSRSMCFPTPPALCPFPPPSVLEGLLLAIALALADMHRQLLGALQQGGHVVEARLARWGLLVASLARVLHRAGPLFPGQLQCLFAFPKASRRVLPRGALGPTCKESLAQSQIHRAKCMEPST